MGSNKRSREEAAKTEFQSILQNPGEPVERKVYATKHSSDPSEYEFLELLGNGSYAIVLKARHIKTDNILAAKVYDKFKVNMDD